MKKLCVIGSLNVDLTITIPRFHAPGETITGSGFATYTGGKGGNQAVALGRLGADVAMCGMVGDDANGRMYLNTLARERVDTSLIGQSENQPTGVALIEVESASGNNRIALNPGANHELDVAFAQRYLDRLLKYDIFLMQLEIPLETVTYLAARLHAAGKTVVLDPAPAVPLSDGLIAAADYITPNETELSILTGMPTGSREQIERAAAQLILRGSRRVVAKMGAAGALLFGEDKPLFVPGFQVNAVDTTAAGDSFNAGFAMALALGLDPLECMQTANATGALSTTRMGAQAAMPSYDDVRALVASRNA